MYLGQITYEVLIGGQRLQFLESLKVRKDLNRLSDTAVIVVPGSRGSVGLQVEQGIQRGMPVQIACGYDGEHRQELEGYVLSVSTDNRIAIEVEDGMFQLRRPTQNKVLKDVRANEIVAEILQGAGLGSSIDLVPGEHTEAIVFDKFTLSNVTAYEALAKLKRQTGYNYYLRGNELHIQLRHLTDQPADPVTMDFRLHIEKSQLKYAREEERLLEVEVIGIDKENKRHPVLVGESGGDKYTAYRYNVTDPGSLEAYGQELLKKFRFTGYEGNVTGWLDPYYTVGDAMTIIDPDYPDREGSYLIERMDLELSKSGGVRKGHLGVKL